MYNDLNHCKVKKTNVKKNDMEKIICLNLCHQLGQAKHQSSVPDYVTGCGDIRSKSERFLATHTPAANRPKLTRRFLLKSFRSVANRQAELTQSITPGEFFLPSDPGIVSVLAARSNEDWRNEGLTGNAGKDFDVTHGTASHKGQTSSRRPFHNRVNFAIGYERCLRPGTVGF